MEEWLQKSNISLGKAFDNAVRSYQNREAVVFQNQRLTYSQLGDCVNQFAKGLLKTGVKKDDHIAIWSTNNLEWVCANFAAHKVGAIVIPVNSRYQALELKYLLRQAECSTLIFKDNFIGKIDAVSMINEIAPEIENSQPGKLSEKEFPLLKNMICISEKKYPGMFNFKEIMQNKFDTEMEEEFKRRTDETSADDIAYIMYTSGTTGTPKGAMIPSRNILAVCNQYNHFHMVTGNSRLICAVPLHSAIGCNLSLLTGFLCGACICVLESWDTEIALELIQDEKVTHLLIVPSMAIMMVNHPKIESYDLSSLEIWASGGSPLSKQVAKQFMKMVPVKALVHGYGCVEGSGIISSWSTLEAPVEDVASSVGRTWPYCKVKIVDPVTLEDLPDGKEGEIWSTDNTDPPCHIMRGYYKEKEENDNKVVNNWLRTGDIGVMKDGYLSVTGRLKDMILVGGFNVYPAEIEEVIRTYPKIKDVSVVGIPDKRLQEVPMAFVQLKKNQGCTEDEIINFCKNKIANIKTPRYILFLDEFPLSGSGKVQKFKLRETAVRELNLA